MKTNHINKLLLSAVSLIVSPSMVSAALYFDGGAGNNDFFAEANWADSVTGADPAADTVNSANPGSFKIAHDLVVGGSFNVGSSNNIRLDNGLTLTVQENATLSSLVYSANNGETINIVLTDNADFTATQNIARTIFDVSGNADLFFTGPDPEFTTDSLNLASDWTGSITVTQTNRDIVGLSGNGLFNTLTIDGAAATSADVIRQDNFESGSLVSSTFTLVPEPSSVALLGLGGLALAFRRNKRG